MDADEYQRQAVGTAVYPPERAVTYPILGLVGEAGEAADKWKKYLRGDSFGSGGDDEVARKRAEYEVARELGDVCWYVAALARDLGFTMSDIMAGNLAKLKDRKDRGVIHGSGDNR